MKSCAELRLGGNPDSARGGGKCGVKSHALFAENHDIAPTILRPTCAR